MRQMHRIWLHIFNSISFTAAKNQYMIIFSLSNQRSTVDVADLANVEVFQKYFSLNMRILQLFLGTVIALLSFLNAATLEFGDKEFKCQ